MNRRPVVVTLRGLSKHRDADWHLRKWGVPFPWDRASLDSAVHHHRGGWAIFALPDPSHMLGFCRKALRHEAGTLVADLVGRLALFSQADLADAIWLIRWLHEHDPVRDYEGHRAGRMVEWRDLGALAVSVLEARWPGGSGLREPDRALRELLGMRSDLDRHEAIIAKALWDVARERALRSAA